MYLASLVLSVCRALPGLQKWIWALCPSEKLLGVSFRLTGAFFFWETVTSLRGSLLPDQKAVRAEVGKLKSWVKMWLHLSAIFSTVENRHMWKLSQLWEQTISLSWVVRAITPLPQLFLLFSELSLVFHLWMKRDLAYLENRSSETLSSKTLWNYFVEAFVLSLQKKWVSSAAVHLESLQIRVILQRH